MSIKYDKFEKLMRNISKQGDKNSKYSLSDKKESKEIIEKINKATKNNFKDFDELIASSSTEKENVLATLTELLGETDNYSTKESIVRALTTPKARKTSLSVLIEEFKKTKSEQLRWVIGNAIESMVDESDLKQLIEIARNKKYGSGREMIVYVLRKFKNPQVVDTLLDLLEDEEIVGHAIESLKTLKPKRAKPYLVPFLDNHNSWIKNSAKKAIDGIDKSGRDL